MNAAIRLAYARRKQIEAALAQKYADSRKTSLGVVEYDLSHRDATGQHVHDMSVIPSSWDKPLLYHGTSRFDLPSIQAVGLVPKVGGNTKDAQGVDKEAEVHLTTSPKIARKYGDVVLKVDQSHPDVKGFRPDSHERKSVATPLRIPPGALVVESRRRSDITHDSLLRQHGYNEVMRHDSNRFGNVVQYLHPATGHQVTLAKRLTYGRQRVRHTNDPSDWTDKWTHVNGRSGASTYGHTLLSLYDKLTSDTPTTRRESIDRSKYDPTLYSSVCMSFGFCEKHFKPKFIDKRTNELVCRECEGMLADAIA